jgi:hypothetical protein
MRVKVDPSLLEPSKAEPKAPNKAEPEAPNEAEAETSKKIRGRPFKPGNPGRPPGAKNRTTRVLEELLAGDAEKVTRKFIELALAGNVRCLQWYIERLLPRRTGRPLDFSLPAVNNVHDAVAAMAAITTGVTNGDLTVEEAGQLVHVLEVYANILKTDEIVTRLENLESQTRKTP